MGTLSRLLSFLELRGHCQVFRHSLNYGDTVKFFVSSCTMGTLSRLSSFLEPRGHCHVFRQFLHHDSISLFQSTRTHRADLNGTALLVVGPVFMRQSHLLSWNLKRSTPIFYKSISSFVFLASVVLCSRCLSALAAVDLLSFSTSTVT